MGNWGNTLDRWYHRAAVVVWPREQAFANRAETSPAWALDELAAMAAAGDAVGARVAAATLAPFWNGVFRGDPAHAGVTATGLLGTALRVADAVADAATAAMLLRPFRVGNLTDAHVKPFAKLADHYGQEWTAEQLRTLFGGDEPTWAYDGREVPPWAAERLTGVCAGLRATGTAGTAAAQRLLDLAWEWIGKDIRSALVLSPPSYRDRQLGDLGKPLAAVLAAATAIGAARTRDTVTNYVQQQDEAVTALEMSALRAAAKKSRTSARGDAGLRVLASDCATRLRGRLARPERKARDWSVELPADCVCDLCGSLRVFLSDKNQRTLQWPLVKRDRQHLHSRIDGAGTARHSPDQARGSPIHSRPDEDRCALRPRAGGAGHGSDGSGLARAPMENGAGNR